MYSHESFLQLENSFEKEPKFELLINLVKLIHMNEQSSLFRY